MSEASICPLAETDDKFSEAHYFIDRMMVEYHNPMAFRYNLNAFLQALRSVTFVLQNELTHRDGFQKWYSARQQTMKDDPLLCRFKDGRNIVVHQMSLEMNSSAKIGIFRWQTLKLAIGIDVPINVPSQHLLQNIASELKLIDPEHSAIGEQYGVRRDWYVPELGEGNVITLCDLAWVKIGQILSDAHDFAGWHSVPPVEHGHTAEDCAVLLETDIDPILPEQWGW